MILDHSGDRIDATEMVLGCLESRINIVAVSVEHGAQEFGALLRVHLLTHTSPGSGIDPPDVIGDGAVFTGS